MAGKNANEFCYSTRHMDRQSPVYFILLTLIFTAITVQPVIAKIFQQRNPTISKGSVSNVSSIHGHVLDKEKREAIIGSIVQLIDRQHNIFLGVQTDINGYFVLTPVPPGIYTIQAVYIGYSRKTIDSIQIYEGLISNIEILLDKNKEMTVCWVTNYSPRYWRKHPWQFMKKKVLKIESL